MAFPSNPSDGDIFSRFNRQYTYNATIGKWSAVKTTSAATLASVPTSIIPASGSSIDIGSTSSRIQDLYLDADSTINIGDRAVTASSFLNFNLDVLPEVLEIQVDAPAAGHGQDWLWTWTTSALPYARINITNSAQTSVPLYKQGTYTINNFAHTLHDAMTQTHEIKLKWIEGAGDQNLIDWVAYSTVNASHPDINGGASTEVTRLSVSVPETITLPTLVAPTATYNIGATTGAFVFTGTRMGNNQELGPLRRGGTYTFVLDGTVSGHPFYLTTDNGANFVTNTFFGEYTSGVTGSRNDSGTITFTVPQDAPNTLYYQCGVHSSMRGVITIKDLAVEVNSNGNYVVYAQHSQEDHATPIELRPVPTLTSQMCLVYDANTNTFVPQDLATYVERTPAFRNKIQEVAGTATLIAPDGTSIVASVQVISDASYLPYSGNTDGDIAYTQNDKTLYIWDEAGYTWNSTKGTVDLTGYATESYVSQQVSNVSVDLTGYATETYVSNQLATVGGSGGYVKTYYWEGALQENISRRGIYIHANGTLTQIRTNLKTYGATAAAIAVKKNGIVLNNITIPASQTSVTTDTNHAVVAGDYITVDITTASSAQDLYVTLVYE